MSDIVARLRNWREVHLARLHLLMEEAADEMEQLSQKCDCPGQDNRANADNVGRKLAQDATDTLTDAERAAVERAIETLDGFQRTGGYHSAVDDDAATLWGLLGRMA